MRSPFKPDPRPDCRLSSFTTPSAFFTPSSSGTPSAVPPHRLRPEELWASPQRLRYLRTLAPEPPLSHPPAEQN